MTFGIDDIRVAPFRFPGREMTKPCVNCPFVAEKEGRSYIGDERMEQIKGSLRLGQPFWCHKSVYQEKTRMVEEDGLETPPSYEHHYMLCRGAVEYAEGECHEKSQG